MTRFESSKDAQFLVPAIPGMQRATVLQVSSCAASSFHTASCGRFRAANAVRDMNHHVLFHEVSILFSACLAVNVIAMYALFAATQLQRECKLCTSCIPVRCNVTQLQFGIQLEPSEAYMPTDSEEMLCCFWPCLSFT